MPDQTPTTPDLYAIAWAAHLEALMTAIRDGAEYLADKLPLTVGYEHLIQDAADDLATICAEHPKTPAKLTPELQAELKARYPILDDPNVIAVEVTDPALLPPGAAVILVGDIDLVVRADMLRRDSLMDDDDEADDEDDDEAVNEYRLILRHDVGDGAWHETAIEATEDDAETEAEWRAQEWAESLPWPDGVVSVTIRYKLLAPGQEIEDTDWTDLTALV